MAEFRNQFEQGHGGERPAACMLCEALLPDAVDGTLSVAEQRIFDQHVASCVECSRELEEAHRGAAWLSMLKSQTPEPPETLLARILAGTTGVEAAMPQAVSSWTPAVPAVHRGRSMSARFAAWRDRVAETFRIDNASLGFQPRLAMTAAMAFFSIALTLNLTGFRVRDVHAETFTPSGLRRSVADMSASAARSFQNLRVVYQVEARVSELRDDQSPSVDREGRRAFEAQPQTAPAQTEPQSTGPQSGETASPDKDTPQRQQDDSRPHGRSDLMLPAPPQRGRATAAQHAA